MLTETTHATCRPLMEIPERTSDHRILIEFHKLIVDYEKMELNIRIIIIIKICRPNVVFVNVTALVRC